MPKESLIWLGDGFNKAKDQIGQPVHINNRHGVVVDATELTIVVDFEGMWHRLWRVVRYPLDLLFIRFWLYWTLVTGREQKDKGQMT